MLSTIAYISKTFPYKTCDLQAQVFGMKRQMAFHKTGDEIIAVVVFRPHIKAHRQTRHFRCGHKFLRLQLRWVKIIGTALVDQDGNAFGRVVHAMAGIVLRPSLVVFAQIRT